MPESGPSATTVQVAEHPLIRHKLSFLRDRHTSGERFRQLLEEITMLMTCAATQDLAEEDVAVETPLETSCERRICEDRLVLVPVLRAGLGMVDAVLRLVPGARVGHLGFYRDEETLQPVTYYAKLPPRSQESDFLVLDPMLATGGTASDAVAYIKKAGAKRIAFMCVLAAPEGAARMAGDHPDVPVYAAALDRRLNALGYILPGLGDAGDRLFGTL